MKKALSSILACVLTLTSIILCGCDTRLPAYKKIMAKDETDGQFYFYYDKDYLNGYAIIGDMEENNPEVMYLPGYYKGEEVKQIFYTTAVSGFGMQTKTFGPSFKNVKRVYIPFLCTRISGSANSRPTLNIDEVVFAAQWYGDSLLYYFISASNYSKHISVFVSNKFFDQVENGWISFNRSVLSKYNIYKGTDRTIYMCDEKTHVFIRSNTTFLFNYSNSPNGDIFFIENYEYGNKIEPTPYLPLREGYMFTGWYKEADCKTKWNFEADTLPIVEYDEEGNAMEFIETKLYAGWQKI